MRVSRLLTTVALALCPYLCAAANLPLLADTYTSGLSLTGNFGASGRIVIGNAASNNIALLLFDLSALPPGTLAKATLTVYVSSMTQSGSFDILPVNSAWSEVGLTAQSLPKLGSAIAGPVPVATARSFVSIDVTALVTQWIASGNFGLALQIDPTTPSASFILDSRENTTTSHPATLDVTMAGIPGPAGVTGPAGPPGVNGTNGLTGPTGPAGASTTTLLTGATLPGDLASRTPGTIAHFTPDQPITITRVSLDQMVGASLTCTAPPIFNVATASKSEAAAVALGQQQYDSGVHALTVAAGTTVNIALASAAVCSSGTHPADANLLVQYRPQLAGDVDACPTSQLACGTACTAVQVDPANCGACGNACAANNGSPSCNNGACGLAACNTGFSNCDNNPANGCEVNINTSVTNCGACGNTCSASNGTAACNSGACSVAACNAGFANCDNNAANGCEVNTQTSVTNCGACGNTCASSNGTASCVGGACAITCTAGFGNCDGNPFNGCEANLNNSPVNCGACGHVCPGGQTCSAGACRGT